MSRTRNLIFGAMIGAALFWIFKVAIIVTIGYFVLSAFGVFDAKAEELQAWPVMPTVGIVCERADANGNCETRTERERRLQGDQAIQSGRAVEVLFFLGQLR